MGDEWGGAVVLAAEHAPPGRRAMFASIPQVASGTSAQGVAHVGREFPGRVVPTGAVLLQRLHHDPVELAADEAAQPSRLRAAIGRD